MGFASQNRSYVEKRVAIGRKTNREKEKHMFGSLIGNIAGIIYFLCYQIIGIYFSFRFFKKESNYFRVFMGSVLGSFALQWFPILTAFFMNFTIGGHITALCLFVVLVVGVDLFLLKKSHGGLENKLPAERTVAFWKEHKIIWILVPTFLYFVYVLLTHTIPIKNGAIYTGQATYGDMSMHLGFISSIAKQGTFPPEYSILPGVKLAYPFLCDSVSSSIHVFGASLRLSYLLPMIFAVLQVFLGFYCLAYNWLKNATKALLAWVLFFYNGGLGFAYFFDKVLQDTSKFTNIFKEFYYTPTSLGDENLRWAQIIVNMLIPQRATLFGWAILFPLLALLYKAIQNKDKKYFWLAGILGGGLPLIHTHSFMALGLVCVVWLLAQLYQMVYETNQEEPNKMGRYIVWGGLVFFSFLQIINQFVKPIQGYGMPMVLVVAILLVFGGIYLLYKGMEKKESKQIFITWGVFLVIILVLAAPQLIGWTFKQAGNGNYVKGHFNWSNEGDQYIWFYLKNIGVTAFFAIPALIYSKKKDFMTAAPLFLIYFVGELVVFQPNVYDNNKLLFVGFVFACCIAASYMVDLYHKWHISKITASLVLVVATVSAVLTMGREYVSEYEIYSASQVELCKYIEENIAPDAVILTDTRHNNAVSSLTGRNIVCGAGTFLYYHGLDYQGREQEVSQMYLSPGTTQEFLKKYNVSYILVGPEERSSYTGLDEGTLQQMYSCVYQEGEVSLYQVK